MIFIKFAISTEKCINFWLQDWHSYSRPATFLQIYAMCGGLFEDIIRGFKISEKHETTGPLNDILYLVSEIKWKLITTLF